MAVNKMTRGRAHVASLMVGESPSSGGTGGVGLLGTPIDVKGIAAYSVTIDNTNLSGSTLTFTTLLSQKVDLTVTGVVVAASPTAPVVPPQDVVPVAADLVFAIPPGTFLKTGLVYNAFVSAANTITLVITNPTGGSLVLVAGKWTFVVLKTLSS